MSARGVGESAVTGSAPPFEVNPCAAAVTAGSERGGQPEGLLARPADLSDYRLVLGFEITLGSSVAARARPIRERFGVSTTTYAQALDRAISVPEALAFAPALVARLRRIRTHRRSVRSVTSIRPILTVDRRQLQIGELL